MASFQTEPKTQDLSKRKARAEQTDPLCNIIRAQESFLQCAY